MRTRGRRRAPIGRDHYEIARGFIDAWLEEIELATFRRLHEQYPEMPADQLQARSIVSEHDDGIWIWVSVATTLRFVINKKSGQIFGVEALVIDKGKAYGYVRWWHGFDWSEVPPRRI